ncbi:MAG TPA: hypothetical protein VK524_22035 [Polyangiaceae bacterium]|nr:hypothetical protein [Polyangiaceae bacterium]
MENSQRDRIISALSAETSELRMDGVSRAVEFVLAQRLRDIVDLLDAEQVIVGALTSESLGRIITRHVAPGWERYSAGARSSGVLIGELVPAPAQAEIQRLITTTRPPRFEWVRDAVDATLLRRLLSPVFGSVLANFVKRLPIPGVGPTSGGAASGSSESGGFAERLTRGVQKRTGKLVDVGRSAMGGFGAELEKRLQAAARDFGGAALELFRDALEERMRSKDGQALVQEIAEHAVARIMKTSAAEVQADLDALPIGEVLKFVPDIVAHAVTHDFVRHTVQGDVRAYLEAEGERPLHDLLAELGLLDGARRLLTSHGSDLARRFFASSAFEEWLGRVLTA